MTNDYRALCAELIDALDSGIPAGRIRMSPLADRARALLDQQEPEGPDGVHPFVVRHYTGVFTDDERPSIKGNGFDGLEIGEDRQEAEEFIAWINERICLTPQPVMVSERLPGPGDCDAGECWAWDIAAESWTRTHYAVCNHYTHWLPANALPTPEPNAQ